MAEVIGEGQLMVNGEGDEDEDVQNEVAAAVLLDPGLEVVEVRGQRGATLFYDKLNGFVFRIRSGQSRRGTRLQMSCQKKTCPGSASMTRTEPRRLFPTSGHIHDGDDNEEDERTLRTRVFARARQETTDLREIYDEELAKIDNEYLEIQNLFLKWQRSLQRARRNAMPRDVPQSLTHFGQLLLQDAIHSQRFTTLKSKQSLKVALLDGNQQEGTAVILLSQNFEAQLGTAQEFHLDGHFKMCPNIHGVYQLLSIMTVQYGHVIPSAFSLMSRKTQSSYQMVLRGIKSLAPQFKMPYAMADYEKALFLAVALEHPDAVISGCLFHFSQAVYKWASVKGGLTVFLNQNRDASRVVRMCGALALLPWWHIEAGFDGVKQFADSKPELNRLKPFLDYVKTTWLEDIGVKHISVYGRAKRTNNDQESFHRILVEKLGKPHGEPWRWVDLLIKLEHVYYRKFASLEAGYEVARDRKKKVRKMNERLARLNRQLCEEKSITPYEFLASASHLCESTYNRVALRKKQRRAAGEVPDDVMHDAQGLLEPEEMGRPPVPLLEDRVDEGYLEAPPQPHLPPAAPAPPAPPAAGANAIAEVAADEPSDSDIRGGEPQGRTAHQNSPARRAAEAAQRRAAEAADLRDAAAEQDQRQTRARVAAAAAADEAARRVARRAQEPLVAPRQTRARAAAAAAAEEAVALAQQEPQRRRLRPRGATATEAAADEVVQAPRRQQRAVPEPRHARQGAVERARARAGVRTDVEQDRGAALEEAAMDSDEFPDAPELDELMARVRNGDIYQLEEEEYLQHFREQSLSPCVPEPAPVHDREQPIQEQGSSRCVICRENSPVITVQPCNHCCLCQLCSNSIPDLNECPLCPNARQVTGRTRIFFS